MANEASLRLAFFVGVFVLMASLALLSLRRRQTVPKTIRWSNNLLIVALDTALLRVAFPILAIGLAMAVEARGWGLFNVLDAPFWLAFVASFLLLDLAIYLQHVMFHLVPVFWRVHRMHHADLEIDVTTGLRFHPIEILLSMAIKLGMVVLLGPPAAAVLAFEIALNATSMFNHSNVWIPASVDRILRRFIVTPDMHRVHHSVHPEETDSNFGFNLPWWDWMFGTYRAQPRDGHLAMTIGLEQFRNRRDLWIDRMLLQPLQPLGTGTRFEPGNDQS